MDAIKGVHVVKVKGRVYCYAWRGGPRLDILPGEDGFEGAFQDAWRAHRSRAGKRKLVLSGSKKATLTLQDSLEKVFAAARQRAKKRALPFDLTLAYLVELLEQSGGKCAVSGLAFDPRHDPDGKYAHNPFGISIDRITPSRGYVEGNVRLVLLALNFAINAWGFDTYLKLAAATVARHSD